MPSPLRKFANETALYGLSSIVGRVLNYLLVPFYTSILIPAEYGVVVEWYAYAAFLQILYTYGMETAYFRFAARAPHYFHVATSALLTSSLVFSALLVLAAAPLARLVGYPGSSHYVYYIAAILAVDTALAIPFAQLRLQKRARRFASIKVFQIILNVLLNVAWLYESPYTLPTSWRLYTPIERVEYIFIANLVANAAAIPLFLATWRQLRFRLPWHSLRPMLVYALPLLLMGLAGTTNEMMSRAALRHWMPAHLYPHQHNDAVLGIFGACYKL
ncbi:MAG: oligosaccharide flippase family protein, partial [Bacteroidota bacterium]